MSCAACSARVENAVGKIEGVTKAPVNLLAGTMSVEYSYYDWDTEETINGVSNVTFGTTVDVEPLLFSEIKFSYSNEYTSEGTATAYPVSE